MVDHRELAGEVHPLLVDPGAPLDWDSVAVRVLGVLDPDSARVDGALSGLSLLRAVLSASRIAS